MLLFYNIDKLFGKSSLISLDQQYWSGPAFVILGDFKLPENFVTDLKTDEHILVNYEAYNVKAL